VIVEFYEINLDLTDQGNVAQLLAIEQKYLDLLFALVFPQDPAGGKRT
jgi:hypothetical protein